jgi:hypothetical protein
MSQFDPNTFLNAEFTEANDTVVIPCPTGEYPAIAEKVEVQTWQKKDGSASGLKLNVLWDIQDDNVRALTGRDKVMVPQQIMLDLNESGTGLDMGKGKNVALGRLREALDLNKPGEPFAFGMITGRMATTIVTHRTGDNPEDIFPEIKKVAKA